MLYSLNNILSVTSIIKDVRDKSASLIACYIARSQIYTT